MQNPKEFKIIESIIESPKKIQSRRIKRDNDCTYIQIGKPIEGWNDLLDTVAYAACHYDKNGDLNKIYMQEKYSMKTDVYDSLGNLEKSYTPDEMKALKYYKYHPDAIHRLLREQRCIYSGSFALEMKEVIKGLEEIFKTNTFKTEKPMKLYRGMDKYFDEMEIENGIYTDKSFVSTSKDIDIAKRFAKNHPIMEIAVPKNSDYIDIDKLFNVDHEHWKEKEYLLNRNSKFLITDYN